MGLRNVGPPPLCMMRAKAWVSLAMTVRVWGAAQAIAGDRIRAWALASGDVSMASYIGEGGVAVGGGEGRGAAL